ncbi:hypothetical protein GCM10007880_20580 [Mesorhizobium amorphae]|nr:hypothetical protein GCM10007880_20580 [Mesorhizobium amorphae]
MLEFLAGAAVEQRIIGIGRNFEDQRQPFGGQDAVAAGKDARCGLRFGPVLRSYLVSFVRLWRRLDRMTAVAWA